MSERFKSYYDALYTLVQRQISIFKESGYIPKTIMIPIGEAGVLIPVSDYRGDTSKPIAYNDAFSVYDVLMETLYHKEENNKEIKPMIISDWRPSIADEDHISTDEIMHKYVALPIMYEVVARSNGGVALPGNFKLFRVTHRTDVRTR